MERWYRIGNRFGGFDWEVKAGITGPRANAFYRDHVVLEPNGEMTLKMDRRDDGRWGCAELRTRQKLHFGRYEVVVAGDLAQVAANMAVFGFFNYPADGDASDGTNEIDVEIAQFAPPNNLNFTLYTKDGAENSNKFPVELPRSGPTRLIFDWGEQHLDWQAIDAAGLVLAERRLDPADVRQIPDIPLPLRLNLWLLNDQTPALPEGSAVRLVEFGYSGPTPPSIEEDRIEIRGLQDGQLVDRVETDIDITVHTDAQRVWLEVLTDTWYAQDPAVPVSPGVYRAPIARFYTPSGTTIPVRAKMLDADNEEFTSPLLDVLRR